MCGRVDGFYLDLLKLLALATMIVDHVGAYLFPAVVEWRIIGRFAMPIFVYAAAFGVLHTSNVQRYVMRLLVCGAVAQPFAAALGCSYLNVCFTLAGGVWLASWMNSSEHRQWALLGLGFLTLCDVFGFPTVDYGAAGVGGIVALVWLMIGGGVPALLLGVVCFVGLNEHPMFVLAAIVPVLVVGAFEVMPRPELPRLPFGRLMFYVAYPAHLAVLVVISCPTDWPV